MSSRPRIRMLHTSDVHLGAYDSTRVGEHEALRTRLHGAFRLAIDAALRERVDLMVIAGDFFDNARVREETLRFAASEIRRARVPVVVVPGNHDHIGPGSVYGRTDLPALAPNLRLMRAPEGETVALEALDVELWGRAHTEQDPWFSPFAEAPARGDAAWQIALGHGHYIHPRAAMQHSFHVREEQLEALDRDYVALGHWERLTRVSAGARTAAYSGCPESLSGSSTIGGRVLIVDLKPDGEVRLTAPSLNGEPTLAHEELPFLEGV